LLVNCFKIWCENEIAILQIDQGLKLFRKRVSHSIGVDGNCKENFIWGQKIKADFSLGEVSTDEKTSLLGF